MRLKNGFLLIELLIAMSIFVVFSTIFAFFIYESIKLKNMVTSRMNTLNQIVNKLEILKKHSYKNNCKEGILVCYYKVKLEENDYFCFVKVSSKFINAKKQSKDLILIGS